MSCHGHSLFDVDNADELNLGLCRFPRLRIDGPYGAPAQDYRKYDVLLLILHIYLIIEHDDECSDNECSLHHWTSSMRHTKSHVNQQGPARLNTLECSIAKQYHEGKVKRTPVGEWNKAWNRGLTSSGRSIESLTTFPLKNEPATL